MVSEANESEPRTSLAERAYSPASSALPTTPLNVVERIRRGEDVTLDRYVATDILGEGSLFFVLCAYDACAGRNERVALKVPREKSEKFTIALRKHHDILTALGGHPNLPRIERAVFESEIPYVAEQLMQKTLAEVIHNEASKLTEKTVGDWAVSLLGTLDHIHNRGVIHGDLKPGNILVDKDKLYISDFNVSSEGHTKSNNTLITQTLWKTQCAGFTDLYASPEQRLRKSIDHRTDIYSIGMVLFHMLAHEIPLGNDTDPRIFNPALQKDWSGFFSKALRTRAQDRYQNAQEMIDALRYITDPARSYAHEITIASVAADTIRHDTRVRSSEKPTSHPHVRTVPIIVIHKDKGYFQDPETGTWYW